jgi:hypothetical protein
MALKARHLESVCAEIESRRSAKGRISRGEITRVLNENKPIYTWLTIDIIRKALKNVNAELIVIWKPLVTQQMLQVPAQEP